MIYEVYSFYKQYKSSMNLLDKFDYAILAALQADATLSIASLSDIVGLSSTPCWKRVERLEEE